MHSFSYELSKAHYEDLLEAAARHRMISAAAGRRTTRQALGGKLIALGRRLERAPLRTA